MLFLKKIKNFLVSKTSSSNPKNALQYIDTPDQLKEACRVIAASAWAAVDAEADSLHHYV